ncbi:MAG TPA: hypothetical protein VFW15_12795 [Thermoanaerobaculia bacterium]|nr:hypothetical protein [Thermoanaerobaculia bacterium]
MDQETADEIKRHFNVVAEGLRSDIRVLAEGLGANTDRLDRLERRLDGFESRFDSFESRFDGFESRFDGFESRFDGFEKRVTAEFTETRAMIRLSYGELERRIVRLEGRGV